MYTSLFNFQCLETNGIFCTDLSVRAVQSVRHLSSMCKVSGLGPDIAQISGNLQNECAAKKSDENYPVFY